MSHEVVAPADPEGRLGGSEDLTEHLNRQAALLPDALARQQEDADRLPKRQRVEMVPRRRPLPDSAGEPQVDIDVPTNDGGWGKNVREQGL